MQQHGECPCRNKGVGFLSLWHFPYKLQPKRGWMLMEKFWMTPRPRTMPVALLSAVANMCGGLAEKKGGEVAELPRGEASFKGQPWQDISKLPVWFCRR